jgi:hypothetical protein
MASPKKTPQERFWQKVNKETDSGCWEWTGGKYTSGYGSFSLNGKSARSHRVSAEWSGLVVTEDTVICHSCDNPICVNPEHLFIGTQHDNMIDKMNKGRSPQRIIRHLSDEEVRMVRVMTGKQKDIAAHFGVGVGVIADIQHKRTYKDVQ